MSPDHRRVGVILVNFGEPRDATTEEILPFLERIFLRNAGLEPDETARARARALARDRAPGLMEEYRRIGGSPLNEQADRQAEAMRDALRDRGWNVAAYSAYQFVAPLVRERVKEAMEDGVEVLVGLPVYPLCGHSTTVAALQDIEDAVRELAWRPTYVGVSGWHHHPEYVILRTRGIRDFVEARGLDLQDDDTLLYFSVHGTPIKYLEAGNRYDRYVEEHCKEIASRLGAERYAVGFQNHTNRRIAWTQPDNEERIREVEERHLVVVPIAFMHEQSETLAELDHGLREYAESLGKTFHRAPVPHDAAEFTDFLADLVEALVGGAEAHPNLLARCRCAPQAGVWCTNGHRDPPPSPYAQGVALPE